MIVHDHDLEVRIRIGEHRVQASYSTDDPYGSAKVMYDPNKVEVSLSNLSPATAVRVLRIGLNLEPNISAAPDLLEACRNLLAQAENLLLHSDCSPGDRAGRERVQEAAREAIGKAGNLSPATAARVLRVGLHLEPKISAALALYDACFEFLFREHEGQWNPDKEDCPGADMVETVLQHVGFNADDAKRLT